MIRNVATALVVVLLCLATARGEDSPGKIRLKRKGHPRLLVGKQGWAPIIERIEKDPLLKETASYVTATADAMIDLPPVQRKLKGRRLLGVSRTCLRRVVYLSLAYRLTGQQRYANRAGKEMLAAAEMRNWNPSHFLDVAEMTTALALGYDWLHEALDEPDREKIRAAIVEKGLKASLPKAWWQDATNNWNQVCHGGLTLGALAVMEHEPDLAERIIARAIKSVPRAMDHYAPDGAYPEGPGYWAYGTTYNVLMIDALESALGDDFGLTEAEGFAESSDYYLHASGPSGVRFGYSDCRPEKSGVQPAMFWFARRRDKPSLLWRQKPSLTHQVGQEPQGPGRESRLLPLVLLWGGEMDSIPRPEELHFRGRGHTPVGLHRSGWDSDATYVGLKAGSPGTNHAHMDIGSFIVEAQGVRWAEDLGKQSYNPLEQAGVDLWNRGQNSQRWQVFRWSNDSHNTLVVDDKLQWVAGKAEILDYQAEGKTGRTVIDMSPVYRFQLEKALRGVALRADGSVLVQDQIQARDKPTQVRWGMVTTAQVNIEADKALLQKGRKKLALRVLAPTDAKLKVLDISQPRREYDKPNPSAKMVTLTVELSPGARERLVVLLCPGGKEQIPEQLPDLKDW
jgi:hypothetical protein